jgi:hypothetical protein
MANKGYFPEENFSFAFDMGKFTAITINKKLIIFALESLSLNPSGYLTNLTKGLSDMLVFSRNHLAQYETLKKDFSRGKKGTKIAKFFDRALSPIIRRFEKLTVEDYQNVRGARKSIEKIGYLIEFLEDGEKFLKRISNDYLFYQKEISECLELIKGILINLRQCLEIGTLVVEELEEITK